MPIEIFVPRLGWSMEEGAFVAWLKKDGEFVRAGDLLFSIEGDKAVQEIESIDSGILRLSANAPKPGDSVKAGDLLGHLLAANEASPRLSPAKPAAGGSKAAPAAPPTAAEAPPAAPPPARRASSPPPVPFISPRAARVAAERGIDWTTVTGTGRNGRIRERDILSAASSTRESVARPRQSSPAGSTPTVLVTGGCGFIGTWILRELLERGLDVVVLDAGERPDRWRRIVGPAADSVPLIRGSLLDRDLLSRVFGERQITHVIHLAALLTPACQADPWEGCRVNVLGSVALFEEIRQRAGTIRGFSYASSVAVFGDEPDHATGGGSQATLPPTFYGAFKKSAELIAEQYWRHFQISSVGIRPQVAYGPEREVGLTAGPSLAARAAARGESFRIGYTGRVGYDYVEDVARAFVRAAWETPPGAHVVDLPGEIADTAEVVDAIISTAPQASDLITVEGPPIPAHAPPRPRFISSLYPDWKTTPLTEGIRRTVEFYQHQQTTPRDSL